MAIQECPWKKNAKHVWWHNIFSGGQIHVIFGQNDFSWNLKFRKNLNFCQKLTSVGKAETLTAKSVCPNYNIPRFFQTFLNFAFKNQIFHQSFIKKLAWLFNVFLGNHNFPKSFWAKLLALWKYMTFMRFSGSIFFFWTLN